MSNQALALVNGDSAAVAGVEKVIMAGDLSQISAAERLAYYARVCESLDLNPYTRPFEYIKFDGKVILYPRKDATDQLRVNKRVTVDRVDKGIEGDLYVVTAYVSTPDGRKDEDMGAVPIKGLTGVFLANAMKKAITQAKRRATLSICGLGWADESEVGDIPGAKRVLVDHDTGEILGEEPQRAIAATPVAAPRKVKDAWAELTDHPLWRPDPKRLDDCVEFIAEKIGRPFVWDWPKFTVATFDEVRAVLDREAETVLIPIEEADEEGDPFAGLESPASAPGVLIDEPQTPGAFAH